MDDMERMEEEFQEIMEDLKASLEKWETEIDDVRNFKAQVRKQLEQGYEPQPGINRIKPVNLKKMEQSIELQEQQIKSLQKRTDFCFLFLIIIILAMYWIQF